MGRLEEILAKRPDLVYELYLAASEVVDDFEDYGPSLVTNDELDEDREYRKEPAISKLQKVRNEILASVYASREEDAKR